MDIRDTVSRVLLGIAFGFVMGIVMYQAAGIDADMIDGRLLSAQEPTTVATSTGIVCGGAGAAGPNCCDGYVPGTDGVCWPPCTGTNMGPACTSTSSMPACGGGLGTCGGTCGTPGWVCQWNPIASGGSCVCTDPGPPTSSSSLGCGGIVCTNGACCSTNDGYCDGNGDCVPYSSQSSAPPPPPPPPPSSSPPSSPPSSSGGSSSGGCCNTATNTCQ